MAVKKKLRRVAPWAVRQMRRVRSVYIAGIAVFGKFASNQFSAAAPASVA